VLGTITFKQNKSIMLSKTQAKTKYFLNEFKKKQEKTNTKNWYFIEITFSTGTFYSGINSVSEFYKRISNSKKTLVGNPSNREWWQKLSPSGFYEPYINKEIVVLIFVMKTKTKLNKLEFKARVKKIAPYTEMKIGYKDQKDFEFEVAFERVFNQGPESKTILFGDIKKYDIKNMIN